MFDSGKWIDVSKQLSIINHDFYNFEEAVQYLSKCFNEFSLVWLQADILILWWQLAQGQSATSCWKNSVHAAYLFILAKKLFYHAFGDDVVCLVASKRQVEDVKFFAICR